MSFFGYLKLGGCLFAAALLLPAATRSEAQSCPVGTRTAESYTWKFKWEAQGLLDDVVSDARQARDHADMLQSLMSGAEPDWHPQATELYGIRDDVNDMGRKLCRLETIRRVTSPWERQAIDHAAPLVTELANDTDKAIAFLNDNRTDLFNADYKMYGADLYERSGKLRRSVMEFEKLGKVHHEDLRLEKALGLIKRS